MFKKCIFEFYWKNENIYKPAASNPSIIIFASVLPHSPKRDANFARYRPIVLRIWSKFFETITNILKCMCPVCFPVDQVLNLKNIEKVYNIYSNLLWTQFSVVISLPVVSWHNAWNNVEVMTYLPPIGQYKYTRDFIGCSIFIDNWISILSTSIAKYYTALKSSQRGHFHVSGLQVTRVIVAKINASAF